MNHLESLKQFTTVVADTGEFAEIAKYRPQDATTNPSLIAKAIEDARYAELVERALSQAAGQSAATRIEAFLDQLFVNFGAAILEVVPGRVSTEVYARLSFDAAGSIAKARQLIALYESRGVPRERVLIKLASTWEGIRAAEELEREGIHCNMTLLFSLAQAIACAEAGATLISPFVGRIYDWYRKSEGLDDLPLDRDPGVESVREIYTYFKKFDCATEVMGASFRKVGQVERLAGCDLLTVSPDLLDELARTPGELPRRLSVAEARASDMQRVELDEERFRWMLNEDAMATEKLAEGIRRFHADTVKLEQLAAKRLAAV